MTIETSELLARLATTLRADIGPAVDGEFARTQAFMASVILERVSRELALGPDHSRAEAADVAALQASLPMIVADGSAEVSEAVGQWAQSGSVDGLGSVIEALYSWGLHEPSVVAALSEIRPVLRRDIDRRMEIAR